MKIQMIKSVVLVGLMMCITGCGTDGGYVKPGEEIVGINPTLADFKYAAGEMVKELLILEKITKFKEENGKVPIIAIGYVKNTSDVHIDKGQLSGRIMEDLINSGGLVEVLAWPDEMGVFTADKSPNSDFFLEGVIMVLEVKAGKKREKTYTYQLRLNDAKRGTTVWQRTIDISKQKRSASMGF